MGKEICGERRQKQQMVAEIAPKYLSPHRRSSTGTSGELRAALFIFSRIL